MAGGLLQLAAYGTQDLWISGNPEITFFKTVYRRHTNFSTNFQDINFTNTLDFGQKATANIHKWGDLLHRLFLIIDLPQIDIVFTSLTVGEVQTLLGIFGITWNTERPPDSQYDKEAHDEVILLINDRIVELEGEIDTFQQMLGKLTDGGEFFPPTWKDANPVYDDSDGSSPSPAALKYYDDIIKDFFNYDKYDIQYRFIDAHRADIKDRAEQLANLIVVQNTMFDLFTNYAISYDGNPDTLNDENIRFYLNVDIANYIISGSINQVDANTVFRGGISNIYGSTPYTYLDAYNIFDQVLNTIQQDILNSSDVQNIKKVLLDNIQAGLTKNIQLLTQIYNTLNSRANRGFRFIFYRRLPVLTGGTFSKISSFNSRSFFSTISQPAQLNDRFTDKLRLPAGEGEINIIHPFSTTVLDAVDTYHTDNLGLYNDKLFTPYFNTNSLWERTDVLTSSFTPPFVTVGARNYFLNYIWFLMAQDIPDSIATYMEHNSLWANYGFSQALVDDINGQLAITRTQIINNINQFIADSDNYTTINILESNTKTVVGPNGDILYSAIFRPDFVVVLGGNRYIIPDYIVEYYKLIINNITPPPSDAQNWNSVGRQLLLNVIDLFVTPYSSIPTYNQYVSQGFNLYNSTGRRINNIGTSTVIYSDAISSIFYHIFKTFVQNTDDLYNDQLLGFDKYIQSVGGELYGYIDTIAQIFFNYIYDGDGSGNFTPYNYYLNGALYENSLPENNGGIGTYLTNNGGDLNVQFDKFFNNRGLLNMREIILSRIEYYFDRFAKIVSDLTDIIEQPNPLTGSLIYTHQNHPNPNSDIVLLTQTDLLDPNSSLPNFNAMDIALQMRDFFNYFVDTAGVLADPTNPYNSGSDPNKYDLWIEKRNTFNKLEELSKFEELFDFLFGLKVPMDINQPFVGPSNLFQQLTFIDVNYNGFSSEYDFYNYIIDYVISRSILKDFPTLLKNTVNKTNAAMRTYLNSRIVQNGILLVGLRGSNTVTGLIETLEKSLNAGQPASFAWIQRLGHYIIDHISIRIGDQIIDTHYGEWLEIWMNLAGHNNKIPGYRRLIGDVPQLTGYNNKVKGNYQLIIPLQFWFNRHMGHSLALAGLLHTDVTLDVKLKDFNDVSYYEDVTKFKRRPKLSCRLLAEYIFIESDERNTLANKKLEYLIETLQFSDNYTISGSDIKDLEGDELMIDMNGIVEREIHFRNPVKSLYWVVQKSSFVNGILNSEDFGDGILVKGERRYHQYSYDYGDSINPCIMAGIKFNNRDREELKDIIFYEQCVPYERHHRSPSTGIQSYSFSFAPEESQPTGAANFDRIDDAAIVVRLSDEVVRDINKGIRYGWRVYGLGLNVLRMMSGMAGLVFNP